MFSNIGKKIKGLAKVIAWTGIVGSVICGVLLAITEAVVAGVAVAVVGSVFSWIGCFTLYGLGQLIDSCSSAAFYAKQTYDKLENLPAELKRLLPEQAAETE